MRISDWSSDVCSSDLIESSQDGEAIRVSKDYNELLPSLHLKWDLTDADRISLSLAGSIKRANFNELIPALLDGEYGDNDYIGNPHLDPETANGLDLGYERRLGKRGVVGVNFFYRDIKNLIELVNTGEPRTDNNEGHTSELQSLMRISYAVIYLNKHNTHHQ